MKRIVISPYLIIGVFVSVGVGILSSVIRSSGFDTDALLLSLFTLTISILLTFIDEVLKGIRLLNLIKQAPDIEKSIVRILQSYVKSTKHSFPYPWLGERIKDLFEKLRRNLDDASLGRLEILGTDAMSFDIQLIKNAEHEILATSHVDITLWWNSAAGTRYWETNAERLKKNVICKRVFIVSKEEWADNQFSPELEEILIKQRAADVEVYLVRKESLEPKHRLDIAIIDEKIYSESMIVRGGESQGIVLCWDSDLVASKKNDFKTIIDNSHPLNQLIAAQKNEA
jgi:hypothetical protein